MDFSIYLKKCREGNNITQEELVADLYTFDQVIFENLDAVTLSRWERQSTTPNNLKKLSIIKFFQQFSTSPLPYWDNYTVDEVEDHICQSGIHNVISKNKQLILNFPSKMMEVDDIKVYPIRDVAATGLLFDINMDLHNAINYDCTKVSEEHFKEWSMHPSNLFLACEFKNRFVGLFFSVRIKNEVFEKIMNFKMKKSDITDSDFAKSDEVGSNLLLSFYAINVKVATMLFVRHYAYLIANQQLISDVGIVTALPEVKKTVGNMNLKLYKNANLDDASDIEVYREKLGKILASEYVVKMLFSE